MSTKVMETSSLELDAAPAQLPSVLVVERGPEFLAECEEMLKTLRYQYYGVSSAVEAIDIACRDPSIQIILADQRMPVIDGFSMVEEIRTHVGMGRPIIPIVIADAITAELAMKALHIGAVDVLRRPLDILATSAALRRAVKRIRQRDELILQANLSRFGQQIGKLALALEGRRPGGAGSEVPTNEELAATLNAIINSRSMRGRFFPSRLFADPAWDILLDLTKSWLENEDVSVSSVCIAASVPMSTALRWVSQMTESGLLKRWKDPKDGRRDLIALTDTAAAYMRDYLCSVHEVMRRV
jgi:CheY-like chemotaxis protein